MNEHHNFFLCKFLGIIFKGVLLLLFDVKTDFGWQLQPRNCVKKE